MTDPIVTTTRVSDKPVRWQTRFHANGVTTDGSYSIELIGWGKTPTDAQANAWTNLERAKARMLVASIAFNRVPSIEGAEG